MDGDGTAEVDEGEDGGDNERHEDCVERDVPPVVDLIVVSFVPKWYVRETLREQVLLRMGDLCLEQKPRAADCR